MTNRNRNFPRTPRRAREWAIVSSGSSGTGLGDSINHSENLLEEWLVERGLDRTAGLTISEIHGFCQVAPSAGETSNFIAEVAAGIGFFSDTVNSASDLPNPRSESASWQSHQWGSMHFEAPDTISALITPTETPTMRLNMHTKSMRKQPSVRHQLNLVVNQTNAAVQTLVLTFQFRILLLLP